ncbi:TerB family tellurite resistance protein [Aeromonas sp. MrichA-1]|uniref:TerB family tellurite resistance protein n=1 Tax=Aeromonas sp. MrichA-1 TaxID=2823362 RepID=UPI0024A78C75|nr:TerB family tellurite resistance protein [Aeromonas sp. MrichA-1]
MELVAGGNVKLNGNTVRLQTKKVSDAKWALIKSYQSQLERPATVIDGLTTSGDAFFAGAADGTVLVDLDLQRMSQDVEKISLVLMSEKNAPVKGNIVVEVADGHDAPHEVRVEATGRSEALLIVAEVYRHNSGWKVKNLSSGFSDAARAMNVHFKVDGWRQSSESKSVASVAVPQAFISHQNNDAHFPAMAVREETTLGGIVMSFLDKLKKFAFKSGEELTEQVARYKNRRFMEGLVALCTYVAMSHNGAGSEEKQKMLAFIKQSDQLKVFDSSEVIEFYNKLANKYEFDREVGMGEAMKIIMTLAEKPDEAQLALNVGIAVAKSDGDYNAVEKEALVVICKNLGLNRADFGL